MSDSVELKPCPFCGGEPELTAIPSVSIHYRCKRCKASGPYHTASKGPVDQWNTRATDPLLDEMAEVLARYRNETPLGHQPHMTAHKVDELLQKYHEQHSLTNPNPQPPQP